MKAIQNTSMQDDLDHLTIPEAEEIIEEALEELAFSSDPGLARALRFLAPAGYQVIVELCGENGRSKRRHASANSWTPEEDEVRIYFERVDDEEAHDERPVPQHRARTARPIAAFEEGNVDTGNGALPPDIDERIQDLCATLWLKRNAEDMPSSRSSGSGTLFCRVRRSPGIRIRSRGR